MNPARQDPVIAFLPCRKGSERVPRKNIRAFGPYQNGLVEIKLNQLLACPLIDYIVLSTNDQEILDEGDRRPKDGRLLLHRRDESLACSETSTDALVNHARELIEPLASASHILWTHVTSPFVTSLHYTEVITAYRDALHAGYDSLMSTTQLYTFLWSSSAPLNYDRNIEKWPRTQTLRPVHEVNSAVFIAPFSIYSSCIDRIGMNPLLYPLNRLIAFDIDWEEDFVVAEQLLLQGLVRT